ncbi:MAG: flagellar biosynthesis protein FlhA [Armatimonadota bacterium]|nr:MAG: flagellar biosynthesis protein FlhA [Armatimonadota bacterium]
MTGIALNSRIGGRLGKYSDLIMAVAVLGVVVMLIVPLPEWLLDTCLVVNLASAALIFLTTLYVQEPLQFSVFPSLLLIATLFRLSLNIAATKLILGSGSAGRVIEAFGNFVVGGDYVVGVVAFLILVIVQFVVITNGAGRVAEVAARFTLDAMPGKQMAIDADLNAGLITEEQAKQRRKAIEEEADFYGAMDGASKFVRGDAIAAVLIIIINIVGGFLIGLRNGQGDAMTVLRTYTLLTVGEGLVAQIPALFISTAAGILVTRTATQTHLGQDLFAQLFSRARPAWIVAGMLVVMALVPGFPIIQLLLLAAALGGIGYAVMQGEKARARRVETTTRRQPAPEAPKGPEAVLPLLTVDTIELELGLGLLGLVDASAGGDLVERINLIRRQTALELGIVLPSVRIRDNLQLRNEQYTIKIKGETVATGEVRPQYLLAMGVDDPQQMESLGGIPTREPAFGLSAYWIPATRRDAVEMLGGTVVEPSAVVATHLTEIIKQHAADILTRQDVQTLLDHIKQHNAAVVQELVPELMTVGEVQKVLQHLLRERIPIRDLGTILETLADYAPRTKDPDQLGEMARAALARTITRQYLSSDGVLYVMTIEPSLEGRLRESVQPTASGLQLAIDTAFASALLREIGSQAESMAAMGYMPVILCSSQIRLPLRRLIERSMPSVACIAYNEVASGVPVEAVAVVSVPMLAEVPQAA